uniref:Sulfotransfer_1 domain-containing protein n=1 Tax=Macrostomum lignano TaxID=282301 RepID=A0A1I8FHI2_9PLAT
RTKIDIAKRIKRNETTDCGTWNHPVLLECRPPDTCKTQLHHQGVGLHELPSILRRPPSLRVVLRSNPISVARDFLYFQGGLLHSQWNPSELQGLLQQHPGLCSAGQLLQQGLRSAASSKRVI